MHELFSDWYNVVQPNAAPETLAKRSEAAEEVSLQLDSAQAAELATFIVRVRRAPPEWFQIRFKTHDESMQTRSIDQELRVLASIVLRLSIENHDDDDVRETAALSLLCSTFGLVDEPDWLAEQVTFATKQSSEDAESVRDLAELLQETDPPQAVAVSTSVARQIYVTLTESNNCLWWALTRYSKLLKVPYDSLEGITVAIAAPTDLLDLVRLFPVTPEVETLLLQVVLDTSGARGTQLSLKSYISSLSTDHVKALGPTVPGECEYLCPIAFGISSAARGKAWQSEFEKGFGIRTATQFAIEAVSLQYFRELRLIRRFMRDSQ